MEEIPKGLSVMVRNTRKVPSWKKDSTQSYAGETDSIVLCFFKLVLLLIDTISGFLDRISANRLPLIVRSLLDTEEAAPQI